jgi:tetratricopeptide (TPR) repeat protein
MVFNNHAFVQKTEIMKFDSKRGLPVFGASIVMTMAASIPLAAGAQATAPGEDRPLQSRQEGNWWQAQMRQFRSYPHLHRAYGLLDQGKLDEAADEMKAYLEIDPRDRNVRAMYISVLYRQKNTDQLLRQVAQLLAQDPEDVTALLYRGLANQLKGDFLDALVSFRQVYLNQKAGKEDRILAASTAADMALSHSRYLEALAALTALASVQNTWSVQYRLGEALAGSGNIAEAEHAYQAAVERTTNRDEKIRSQSALAYLAQKRGDSDRAIQYGEAILALDPMNIEWLRTLAYIHYSKKNYRQAQQMARRALGVTKALSDRIYLANVLAEEKSYAEAIDQYTIIAQEATDEHVLYDAHMALGYAYQATGNRAAAHQSFARAVQVKPAREAVDALTATGMQAISAGARPVAPTDLAGLLADYENHRSAHGAAAIGYLYAQTGSYAKAVAYLEDALSGRNEPAWRLLLAEQYANLGDRQKAGLAVAAYVPQTALDWRRLSEVYLKIGNREQAVAALSKGADTVEARLQLSQQYVDLQQPDKALAQLQAVLGTETQSGLRAQALRQVAYIELNSGNDQQAVAAFQSALGEGDTAPATRKDLGFLFMKLEQYPQAMEQFLHVLEREPTAQNMISVARTYSAMKQTEPALQYYRMAEVKVAELDIKEQGALYVESGYLLAEQRQFAQARHYLGKAAAADNSPDLQMSLAYTEERDGMPKDALARLDGIDRDKLNTEQKVRLLDQYALLHEKSGNPGEAARYLEQGLALAPSAGRHYQLALIAINMAKYDVARSHLEEAIRMAPHESDYSQQLAYVCKRQGDKQCAIGMFEHVAARDPGRVAVYQDLAYTYAQAGDNDKSIAWFKKAIDNKLAAKSMASAPLSAREQPDAAVHGGDSDDQQIYALRQQVREMTRRYQFNAYQSYRSNTRQAASTVTPGFATGGLVPSQGGIELLYQPHGIGYRDGRTFRLFGRTLWSNQPEALRIDSSTIQGGIGVEYKPLRDANIYVTLERLIKFGSQSENNWLARASWGYSDGYDMKPNQSSWNQTIIYADAGYFLQHDNIRSVYAEVRQGRAYNVNDTTIVTPHVTVAGRGQDPDPFDVSYLEVGAGISVKYLFNATRYEAARSNGELTVQYRKAATGERRGGWLLTVGLRF